MLQWLGTRVTVPDGALQTGTNDLGAFSGWPVEQGLDNIALLHCKQEENQREKKIE
jgi:hypothetical protein